jgi:predicted permease
VRVGLLSHPRAFRAAAEAGDTALRVLPHAVSAVIIAVHYGQGQREIASAVLFSYVLSIATLGAFIALT